ncbi:MAG: carboxypeptidase regulatory-like domain-containing protein, partial [bacterium]
QTLLSSASLSDTLPDGSIKIFSIGSLSPGQSGSITLDYFITESASSTLINRATITATSNCPVQILTQVASCSTHITGIPGISLIKEGPAESPTGATITYTLSYKNTGQTTLSNISILDTLPNGSTKTFTIADLSPGTLGSITLDYFITESASSTLINRATITATSNCPVQILTQVASCSTHITGIPAISISGTIRDASGNPISSVQVFLTGQIPRLVLTDKNGSYTFTNLPAGWRRVAPHKTYWTFTPSFKIYEYLESSVEDCDFTGTLTNFWIKGSVKLPSGKSLGSCTVKLKGTSTDITLNLAPNINTFYFEGLPSGTYTLSCARPGFVITPGSYTIYLSSNISTITFTGSATALYSISGTVTDSSNHPISGVRIFLSGQYPGLVLTNSNGTYCFNSLYPNYWYRLSPYKKDMSFFPEYVIIEQLIGNTVVNFTKQEGKGSSPPDDGKRSLFIKTLPDTEVWLNKIGSEEPEFFGKTDAEGNILFAAEEGEYILNLKKEGFKNLSKKIEIKETAEDIEISLEPEEEPEVSCSTMLYTPYPNPAKDKLYIPYTLSDDREVTIELYNILGQKVREANLGFKKKGNYTKQDRAGTIETSDIATGIYFLQFKAGKYKEIKRIAVMK